MQIGSMIREIRKSKLLTLKDVARMTGLTQGLISRVENDKVQPSITSLIAISRALNTPIALLFGEDANRPSSPVLRSIERPVVHTKSGITYYLLSRNVQETQIEMLYVEYEKNASTGVMLTHAGFECGLVLDGKLEIMLDDQRHVLNFGDSITIPSSHPHEVTNISEGTTRAIWVNTPPTF